jgi:histone-lysine N-methyltransferase SETMAR
MTPEQREDRVTSCEDIIAMADADKVFLNKIITRDETSCFVSDPETKRQISEWVDEISPRPKKLKFQMSRIKTMLIIFINSHGVVHKEFVPEGKTVNAEFYKRALDPLLKRIQRVRPAAFCSQEFFCCTIMCPPTKMQCLPIFDPKKVTTLYNPLPHPYSPDLSPPDYFLIPKLKMKLKGLHFADVAEIQETVTDELKKVQKEEFSAAFQKLYHRAKARIYTNGTYFEFKKRNIIFITYVRFLKNQS